jgi:branched-chain amino acid transport system substrate-binding protein
MFKKIAPLVSAALISLVCATATAQEIKIGLTGTFTGANAANGIPYRNASEIFPTTMGGVPVKWIVLDDAGDATNALKNTRRFIDVDKVDAIVGSTSTPTATAMFDAVHAGKTPQLAMSPVTIPADRSEWTYHVIQPAELMVSAVVDDMKKQGVKTAAFIGFSDGWGDLNWTNFEKLAAKSGIKVVAAERYGRTDPSVTAQILKIVAANPDAVFVGASATPAVLPHVTLKDQGFRGKIYHTHGTISQAFLNSGGQALEGARMPTGPMVVAADLPDSNPIKAVSNDFITKYQAKFGSGAVPPFAGYAWDAMRLLDAAAATAVKKAKPGTEAFREELKNALNAGKDVVGTNAVYRHTAKDHYGVDERARVLVEVRKGAFRLAN